MAVTTTLTYYLAAYYLAGIACLLVLDYADHLNLAAMAKAVREVATRRYQPYEGRHRADGPSTMQAVDEKRAARAALREDTVSLFLPPEDKAPLCPPMYPIYDHHLGVGRYAHLRQDELDATVERDLRRWKVPVAA